MFLFSVRLHLVFVWFAAGVRTACRQIKAFYHIFGSKNDGLGWLSAGRCRHGSQADSEFQSWLWIPESRAWSAESRPVRARLAGKSKLLEMFCKGHYRQLSEMLLRAATGDCVEMFLRATLAIFWKSFWGAMLSHFVGNAWCSIVGTCWRCFQAVANFQPRW